MLARTHISAKKQYLHNNLCVCLTSISILIQNVKKNIFIVIILHTYTWVRLQV